MLLAARADCHENGRGPAAVVASAEQPVLPADVGLRSYRQNLSAALAFLSDCGMSEDVMEMFSSMVAGANDYRLGR